MLSTNLREIAEQVNQMAGLWIEHNGDDPDVTNKSFAWGVALGAILREAAEAEQRGF